MSEAQPYVLDKSKYPRGEWDNEPDKVQWKTEAGFPALIVRSQTFGALCGYVGVPKGHPAYEKHYDEVDVEIHGG